MFDQFDYLNLAAIKIGTRVLGPGYRAAIWVQGCPFSCKGCIAPEWTIPGGTPYSINQVVDMIINDPEIEGLTISGGEPMMQAYALYRLVNKIKYIKEKFTIICFTGFLYENLISKPPSAFVTDFLGVIDVLIDGPYIEKRNDNLGLRGSSNQRIINISNRLIVSDFDHQPRKIEINFSDREAFIIGIPPKNFSPAWDTAMQVVGRSK